ncbi:MAG: pilus assembly protein PilM [Planctomycetota bacterium]|jgi:type IV pilus assembly protein PilM
MAATHGVWAIDIGVTSLKALRLREGEEGLEVIGFSHIEHALVIKPGMDQEEKDEIVSETLRRFLENNDIGKEEVAISIAGQNSFARFIKLPPVEAKKIPEVVQFEAIQQIPFEINEVEWDWQLMDNEDSPDKEVGLFAIKNELIAEVMDHFTKEDFRVSCVQIAPMALYNFACYDMAEIESDPNKATIIMDMGADNTTLVICTKDSVWQRSIRVGGNTFTQAIADTFKKDMKVAEKLKRTAPMSKYMRQIYTAMKPVYTDLGGEIQRSLGFYSSSPAGRDKTFSKVIAIGGGMKLQGLAKYLTQTLGIPVVKPDSYNRLELSADVSSAKFHENVSDFGVVYGLGVQLLDESKISTNMLPRRIARAMAWTRKAKMFTIAASVLLAVMVLGLGKAFKDSKQYDGNQASRNSYTSAISKVDGVNREISEQKGREQLLLDEIKKEVARFKDRNIVPMFNETILKCLPTADNTPSSADLYNAFNDGNAQMVVGIPRNERKQLFLTRFAIEYTSDVETAGFPQSGGRSRSARPSTPKKAKPSRGGMVMGGGQTTAGEKEKLGGGGFTILIEGYSPYRNIAELLDPPMPGSDQEQWGIVTRFENLEKLFPGTPFVLFKKHQIEHFTQDTGWVEVDDPEMPLGIGIEKEIERVPNAQPTRATATRGTTALTRRPAVGNDTMMDMTRMPGQRRTGGTRQPARAGRSGAGFVYTEAVLVDPMTNEEMSRTYDIVTQKDIDMDPELDETDLGRKKTEFGKEKFIERDQWFRLQAKFVWKDAPKSADTSVSPAGGMNRTRGRMMRR